MGRAPDSIALHRVACWRVDEVWYLVCSCGYGRGKGEGRTCINKKPDDYSWSE